MRARVLKVSFGQTQSVLTVKQYGYTAAIVFFDFLTFLIYSRVQAVQKTLLMVDWACNGLFDTAVQSFVLIGLRFETYKR